MKSIRRSKKGICKVLATLMMIILTFVSGLFLFSFVTTNIDFMKATFNTQMTSLFLDSFSANTTHIILFIRNTADQIVGITKAYANSVLVTILESTSIIKPLATAATTIIGQFIPGITYLIQLISTLSIPIVFTVNL